MAQATTYNYAGNPYTSFTNFTTCEAGPCANYTGAMRINGAFQTTAPLGANLVSANIVPQLAAFTFSDGLTTYASTDGQVRLFRAVVSTDGLGNITALEFTFQRWLTATPAAICETPGACDAQSPPVAFPAAFTDPNTKYDQIQIRSSQANAFGTHNASCTNRGVAPSGVANTCLTSSTFDNGSSRGNSAVALPVVAPAAVPTLTEWAMILFTLMLAGTAAVIVQRRRVTA